MAKLYFYYSAMNAGKSTVLLQSSYNYQERGMRTLVFVPAIDTRSGLGRVRSRIGLEAPAEVLTPTDNLLNRVRHEHTIDPIACVLIDEAQFLTRAQVEQLSDVADVLEIPVLCYGLRTDFQGQLFPGSGALLERMKRSGLSRMTAWLRSARDRLVSISGSSTFSNAVSTGIRL